MSDSILSPAKLEAIRQHLETRGFVAVLHWHWCAGRSPTPLGFADFDEFMRHVRTHGRAGDAFDVWPFPDENVPVIAEGKVPDADGRIPTGGAY